MKALQPEQYAALLEQYVLLLEAQMQALKPSGWPVGSLSESYAQAEAHAALGGVWESGIQELAYQAWQHRQSQRWAKQKTAHMYI